MPVLEIKALSQSPDVNIPKVLAGLCRAVSDDSGVPLAYISATWQTLAPGRYVAGGEPADTQPVHTHPVICHLTCFEMDDREAIRALLRTVGGYLERTLGLQGNVFVLYHLALGGQVYDEGEVVEGA